MLTRSREIIALIIGIGVSAGLYYLEAVPAEEKTPESGVFQAADEPGESMAIEGDNNGDIDKGRIRVRSGRQNVGFSKYPTASGVRSPAASSAQDSRNIGVPLSPDDPIFTSGNGVKNIGAWIDPDDDNTWMPLETHSVRNIGEYLDPDSTY